MRSARRSSPARFVLVGLLLTSMLAGSGCRPALHVDTEVDQRSASELRQAAQRDLKIAAAFQVVSLGLFAWSIGDDSLADGDRKIMVTSAALTGLLSFGALYNGVTNSVEAQQRAALRSDEKLEEFARRASAQTPEP